MHKRLISFLKKTPTLFLIAVISAEIGAIFLVFQFRLVAKFTNLIVFEGAHPNSLMWMIYTIITVFLIRALFQFLTDYFSKQQAGIIKSLLRNNLAKKMTKVGVQYGKNSAYYETLFLDGVEALDNYFGQFVPQILISIFVPLTILFFIIPLDSLTVLILVVTAPLIPLFMMLIGRFSKQVTEKQYQTLSLMNAFFLDSIRGIKTLLIFNQDKAHLNRIKKVSDQYHTVTLSVLKVAFLSAFALEFISTLSTAVLAVEIGLRLMVGKLGFETAFFILLVAPEFYLPLRNLGLRFHAAMDGVEAGRKIYEFLDLPEPLGMNVSYKNFFHLENFKAIQFKDVVAIYPKQSTAVLQKINFDLPMHQSTAIIGQSGSGKSTIFQIILRFLDPSSGFVGLDDFPLKELNIEQWRSFLGWVPQKPYLYNGTLLENIRMAKPGASLSEINRAVKQAHLSDFVDQSPMGLETKISDLGTQVSAGQRQRIAIARVLLKDAKILLFDELTASIDSFTEEKILDILHEYKKTKTLISIAHRLHTILDMDQIVIVHAGKIEGCGHHQKLLQANQYYREYIDSYFGVGA